MNLKKNNPHESINQATTFSVKSDANVLSDEEFSSDLSSQYDAQYDAV